MAKIKVRIDKKGNTHFEVQGIEGESCTELTEGLIDAVGSLQETEYTNEYLSERPDFIEQE